MRQPDSYEFPMDKKGSTCNCSGGCHVKVNTSKKLKYKRFDKSLPPMEKKVGNAGFDLYFRGDGHVRLDPGQVARIPLNVATKIPDGYVGFLMQRSSTYSKWGIKLTNGIGVIDSSFSSDTDEWLAEIKNETSKVVILNPGDKICQAVLIKIADLVPDEVEELGGEVRGGFGSSGSR